MRFGIAALRSEKDRFPLIEVAYDLADLHVLSPILGEMIQKNIVPKVFVWDRGESESEVAVLFYISEPNISALQTAAGFIGRKLFNEEVISHCKDVFFMAESKLLNHDIDLFVIALKNATQATLVVLDASMIGEDPHALLGEAVQAFIIDEVLNQSPSDFLLLK